MNCKNCGNVLESNAAFCSKCGAKVEYQNISSNGVNTGLNPNQSVFNSNGINSNQNVVNNQPSAMYQNTQTTAMNTNQNYYNQQINTTNKQKNNNTIFIILIIVISILIVCLGIFIGVKLLSGDNVNANQNINNNNNNQNNNSANNEKVSNNNSNQSSDKITISGFTFTLPTYLKYSNGSDYIYAANNDVSMVFNFYVTNYPYENIKSDFQTLEQNLVAAGATIVDAVEGSYNGRNFVIVTLIIDGYYAYYYVTKLDNNYIVEGMIQSATEDEFETAFKAIDEIINSAKTTSSFVDGVNSEFNTIRGYNDKLTFEE